MTRVLVAGIGNAHRGDDGAGLAVARMLQAKAPAGVSVTLGLPDAAALLDSWENVPLAIVIDASSSGAAPGTVRRFEGDASALPPRPQGSTHGLGVAEAIALGRALGRMPGRMVVYGIEGEDFGLGEQLSPAVRAAVAPTAARILEEIGDA